MRRIIGYIDGKPLWSENEPSAVTSFSIRGSLVVGESQVTRDRASSAKHREKKKAEAAK